MFVNVSLLSNGYVAVEGDMFVEVSLLIFRRCSRCIIQFTKALITSVFFFFFFFLLFG